MRLLNSIVAAGLVLTSLNCQAAIQWTACVTVVGVSNYIPSDNALVLAVSPAVAGCTSTVNGVAGTITFKAGTLSVTSANLNSILASALTAYASGKSLQLLYDNSSGCFGENIANGGYSGVCP